MQKFILFLFAVPILSFIVIGLYQFLDENFKKEFRLERRAGRPAGELATRVPKRRYTDSAQPDAAPEKPTSATNSEAPVAQVNGI